MMKHEPITKEHFDKALVGLEKRIEKRIEKTVTILAIATARSFKNVEDRLDNHQALFESMDRRMTHIETGISDIKSVSKELSRIVGAHDKDIDGVQVALDVLLFDGIAVRQVPGLYLNPSEEKDKREKKNEDL